MRFSKNPTPTSTQNNPKRGSTVKSSMSNGGDIMDEVTKKMMKMVEDQKERNVSIRCNRVLIKAKKIEE